VLRSRALHQHLEKNDRRSRVGATASSLGRKPAKAGPKPKHFPGQLAAVGFVFHSLGGARPLTAQLAPAGSVESAEGYPARGREGNVLDYGFHRHRFVGFGFYDDYPYHDDYAYYGDRCYNDSGGCYVVNRRVHTTHGWRIRQVEVCSKESSAPADARRRVFYCWTLAGINALWKGDEPMDLLILVALLLGVLAVALFLEARHKRR
jgi:hypothetical protein